MKKIRFNKTSYIYNLRNGFSQGKTTGSPIGINNFGNSGELFTFACSNALISIPGSVFGYLESGVSFSIRFAGPSIRPRACRFADCHQAPTCITQYQINANISRVFQIESQPLHRTEIGARRLRTKVRVCLE